MSIPRMAVNRPVTVWMLTIGLIVIGAVSMVRLPLALLPDINYPAAAVIVEYPNVGPWEVEAQVTRPIEEAIATVSNVTRVTSVTEAGVATIVAQFNWDTDMDFATLEMRERIDLILGYLPDGVERPRVFKFDPSMSPIFQFNIGGQSDLGEARRFAEDVIKPRFERIEGVASVSVDGGWEREIRIELDQMRLEQYNISIDLVRQALMAGNLNFPAGTVTNQGREFLVRTIGEFASLEEIAKTVVHVGPAGMVRIEDIGTVRDTFKPETRLTRLNGQPSVSISLQKESEANTVQVSNRIWQEVERLRDEFGDEVEIQVVWDDARMIRMSVRSVLENGLIGAAAATLVLWVFLGALAPTITVAIAIPVAAVATFFFLYLFDVSLNMLSLGGLALGIGMLVDNSIVSLENIARLRELGTEPKEASAKGAEQVGGALFASTATTIAIFLPVVFVGGLAAEIFSDLSLAVSVSLGMSLLVALTFVPMFTTRIRIAPASEQDKKRWIQRLTDVYGRALAWALDHKGVVIGGVVAAFVVSLLLFPFVGREFLPDMDTSEFDVSIRLTHGTPTERTDRLAQEFESYLARIPEVDTVTTSVSGERADLHVGLKPVGERRRSQTEIVEDVRAFAESVPGADISVTPGDPFGVEGALSAPISILVRGADMNVLSAIAEDIAEIVRSVPGTREVDTSVSAGRPELQIRIDRDRAAQYGLTVAQVASAARVAVDGAVTTRYRAGGVQGQEIDVTVQLADEWRESKEHLERLLISTPLGINVRLGDIAEITEGTAPVEINREGGSRVVRVYGHIVDRDLSSVSRDIEAALAEYPLPSDVIVTFGGEVVEMEDAFGQLEFALLLGVILVYMILAAQFESLLQPFVIMFSVPMAFIGVVLGLLVTGRTLSVPAMIGVIMTAGIVVNNAIVLIDFINQLRAQGMERRAAVLESGRTRMRPVLMTTATTVLGMVPMVLGLGEGAELQAPIATVVVGGLTVSTVLTLGLIPVLYELFDEWKQRFDARRARRKGKALPGAPAPADVGKA